MLVLSRKKGEEVVIQTPAGEVRMVVHSISGYQVRLGFSAPSHIRVDRSEVHAARMCNDTRAELGEARA
ncbi:MAG: carbon storage regulator [Patescibacteria group bacterium]|nr:carbon storage regulator [Patescibacteria group bacterium]